MRFGLLGPLEVVDGSRVIVVQRARVRALLALLLLNARRVIPAEQLADQLWGAQAPANPVGAVQNYVSILRRLLEPNGRAGEHRLLLTRPAGYVLQVEDDCIDAAVFDALAAGSRNAVAGQRWADAVDLAGRALALWRGPALADFRYHEFAQAPAQRLEGTRRVVEEDRISARLALGEHAELVGELEAAVRAEPLRESLWGHLMLALYRAGRQADALRAYQTLRRTLGDELGLEPNPDLQRLEEAILLQKPELDWQAPADEAIPAVSAPTSAAGLPIPLTRLIGRDETVAHVARLLDQARLVTLTGPGGVGKTRVALAVAEQRRRAGEDVVFVDLAALAEPDAALPAVSRSLGFEAAPARSAADVLRTGIGDRRLLLVLDNFERLIPVGPEVVGLLVACPNLRALVTSRTPLRVAGERRVAVAPLALPDAGTRAASELATCDSVALFVDRAEAVQPAFRLTDENAAPVADVCRHLDGLPLAIELAAARAEVLSAQAIQARLERRLEVLRSDVGNVPDRHRTLRATLDWSYELLDPADQRRFAAAAAFAGDATLDALSAVWQTDSDSAANAAATLVNAGLMCQDYGDGEPRFRLLETVREYARERLEASGGDDEVHRRHAAHYLGCAERASAELHYGDDQVGMAAFDREHDNIVAALKWLLAGPDPGGATDALRMVDYAGWYWYTRGYIRPGRDWIEHALDRGRHAPAALRAEPCYWLGAMVDCLGDHDRARPLMQEAVALAREAGDDRRLPSMLNGLATVAYNQGDLACARTTFEESLESYRAFREQDRTFGEFGMGTVLVGLGILSLDEGDTGRAAALLAESIEHYTRARDAWSIAVARVFQARVALEEGRLAAAQQSIDVALPVLRERGDNAYLAQCLEWAACVAARREDPACAGRLMGAATALRQAIGAPLTGRARADVERHLAAAQQHDPDVFEAAKVEGARMTLDEVRGVVSPASAEGSQGCSPAPAPADGPDGSASAGSGRSGLR